MGRMLIRIPLPLLLVASVAVAAPASAQEANLAEIILVQPVQGHSHPFEEGVRRHMDVLRDQGVDDAWLVWSVATGENTGQYLVGTFGRTWASFDEMPGDPEALQRSFRENIQPHVERAEASFWRMRGDLSRLASEGGAPSAFVQAYHYFPRLGGAEGFEAVVREIGAAAESQGWGEEWGVYELVNGGRHPHYVITMEGDRFADFEEPSPNMGQMLMAELGEDGAGALFQRYTDAVESETSEMLVWREDLSYMP